MRLDAGTAFSCAVVTPAASARRRRHGVPGSVIGTIADSAFKEVSAAYDVLGDDTKRKEYDEARRLIDTLAPTEARWLRSARRRLARIVPEADAWVYSPAWQEKLREADTNLAAGRVRRFEEDDDFLAHLEALDDEAGG